MRTVLICAGEAVVEQLAASAVWREGLERQVASSADQAMVMASAAKPVLVVVDRDLPRAEYLVEKLRAGPGTQRASIVIVAAGDHQSTELGLLTAGANTVLRLPPTAEWDERIQRDRKSTRLNSS